MTPTPKELDVTVDNGGGIFQFHLHTAAARAWVTQNLSLDSWQWAEPSLAFAVEHRYAADIAQHMIAAGLEVS